jgi:hypothetical protein
MRGFPFELILVLLTFIISLVGWALRELVNKEAPPIPQRPQPPAGWPNPPRPAERAAQPPERDPSLLWSGQPSAGSRPRGSNASEDVIILSSETLRTPMATVPRSTAAPARPRPVKRRQAPASPAGRPEPAKPRRLGEAIGQNLAATHLQPMEVKPLLGPQAVRESATAQTATTAARTSPALENLRAALATPDQVRQAFLLAELLRPPLALRNRPKRRAGV